MISSTNKKARRCKEDVDVDGNLILLAHIPKDILSKLHSFVAN